MSVSVVILSLVLLNLSSFNASAAQDNPHDSGDLESSEIKINYDEYPMVVPKRSALLLDRMMVMLQRFLEDQESEQSTGQARGLRAEPLPPAARVMAIEEDNDSGIRPRLAAIRTNARVGLQRRDYGTTVHPKGKVWKCLFNAVTCFRRK